MPVTTRRGRKQRAKSNTEPDTEPKTKSKSKVKAKANLASSRNKKPKSSSRQRAVNTESAAAVNRSINWDHAFYLMRPLLVLILVGFVTQITLYVEMKPTRGVEDIASLSGKTQTAFKVDKSGIVDSGFVATSGLHSMLKKSQFAVDVGALLNSLLVIGCQAYCAYIGLWEGEFGLAFRITFAAWLRAFCGWFTYLPASKEYLQSNYDFPDLLFSGAAQSVMFNGTFPLTPPCTSSGDDCEVPPFVSFFSGHVANTVMVANYVYLHGNKSWGKALHALNVLQVMRLLATRGHYSIDIIVGWIVAVYVTNPAEKLGSYFSRATRTDLMAPSPYVPTSSGWDTSGSRENEVTLRDASRSWFESLIYADGIGKSSGVKEYSTPIEEIPPFRLAVEGMSFHAAGASKRFQESLRDSREIAARWLELEQLKKACIERGIYLPSWLLDSENSENLPSDS